MCRVCVGVDLHGGEGKMTSGVCVVCVWEMGRTYMEGKVK